VQSDDLHPQLYAQDGQAPERDVQPLETLLQLLPSDLAAGALIDGGLIEYDKNRR
jgi:hypothetical protein